MRTMLFGVALTALSFSPSIVAQDLVVLDQLTPAEGGSIASTFQPESFSGIGDFNGDGIADFALGDRPVSCGEIDVFFGSAELFNTPLDVNTLDGSNGRRIISTISLTTPDECARGFISNLSSVGDFDDDGFSDFSAGPNMVFFGGGDPTPVTDPRTCGLPGSISPPCAEHFTSGWREGSSAGDFNNDGMPDLLVGDFQFNGSTGRASVVFGSPSIITDGSSTFSLDDIDGSNGLHLNGAETNDDLGVRVAAAGDVNNDNFDDVIVAVADVDEPGKAAVLLGTNGGFVSLNAGALNGTVSGFTVLGATDDEGISEVTGDGDLNGDLISDLVVARRLANEFNGSVDVIFGRQGGFSTNVDVTALDGSTGFSITGGDVVTLGEDVVMAGDLNGDGLDDLAIGSTLGLAQEPAGVFVIFGSRSGFPATFDVSDLEGSNGFVIQSARADSVYTILGRAGDVNNDGVDDLLVAEDGSAADLPWIVFGNAAPKATANEVVLPVAVVGAAQSSGLRLSTLFAELHDDVDAFAGVAVRGATATGGVWQFQSGAGIWQDLPLVSDTSALLLEPDDLLRFAIGSNGVAGDTGTLSVRLWDGRWRDAGGAVDITNAIGALGGFADDDNLVIVEGRIVSPEIFSDSFEN